MDKIKTEEIRRERSRPKLDARITEEYAPSKRQALNKMYMYEGVHLLSVAATEKFKTARSCGRRTEQPSP